MAQKKNKKSELSAGAKMSIGIGLTAAAVTAAGAYFLYGSKQSSQNRKKVKGWVLKAKGDVLEALENAKAITEDEYKALVETASGAYGTVKNATAGEVKDFKKEMSDHWQKLQASKAIKKVVGVEATTAKKVAKKTPAKSAVKKSTAKGGKAKK